MEDIQSGYRLSNQKCGTWSLKTESSIHPSAKAGNIPKCFKEFSISPDAKIIISTHVGNYIKKIIPDLKSSLYYC
jgi:hypothetical protein